MSVTMDDGIKRWTAKRKSALVVEIIQGKTSVSEASRAHDLAPSEIWTCPRFTGHSGSCG
ncbi:transposase IS3/IS911 family protein, partial [Roseivivax marinus]